jgi:phosphoglycolate phosphatase-like HAD superfamily hydrolase
VSPVYVGDTINDALAASAAGIPFVYAGTARLAEKVRYHIADVNGIADLCTFRPRVSV